MAPSAALTKEETEAEREKRLRANEKFFIYTLFCLMVRQKHIKSTTREDEQVEDTVFGRNRLPKRHRSAVAKTPAGYINIATELNKALFRDDFKQDYPAAVVATRIDQIMREMKGVVTFMERTQHNRMTRTMKLIWSRRPYIKHTGTIAEWLNGRRAQVMGQVAAPASVGGGNSGGVVNQVVHSSQLPTTSDPHARDRVRRASRRNRQQMLPPPPPPPPATNSFQSFGRSEEADSIFAQLDNERARNHSLSISNTNAAPSFLQVAPKRLTSVATMGDEGRDMSISESEGETGNKMG